MAGTALCEVLCAANGVVVTTVDGQLFLHHKPTIIKSVTCAAITPSKPNKDSDAVIVAVGTAQKSVHILHVSLAASDKLYTEQAQQ